MIEKIDACSFDEAYDLFLEDYPKFNKLKLIDINSIARNDDHKYENLGVLFCYLDIPPGENANKTKTQVKDKPGKGTKNWESRYLVVDRFRNVVIKNFNFKYKKEAVDAARIYTNDNFKSTFVILGKSLINSDRTQAEIHYKPSNGQKDGVWVFIC